MGGGLASHQPQLTYDFGTALNGFAPDIAQLQLGNTITATIQGRATTYQITQSDVTNFGSTLGNRVAAGLAAAYNAQAPQTDNGIQLVAAASSSTLSVGVPDYAVTKAASSTYALSTTGGANGSDIVATLPNWSSGALGNPTAGDMVSLTVGAQPHAYTITASDISTYGTAGSNNLTDPVPQRGVTIHR